VGREERLRSSEANMEGGMEDLLEEIALLKKRVDGLERRLEGEPGRVSHGERESQSGTRVDKSRTWTEGSVANIMSRGALVSLILLVALVLRVLTDNGMVTPDRGSLLGIGYTILLVAAGSWMYRNRSSLAPILSIAGILLLAAVAVESHTALGTVSARSAYMLMVFAAGGLTVTGTIYAAALPMCVGIITALVAGVPLDFPGPDFVSLMFFLASINVMAFAAARLRRCRWLRPTAFAFTAVIFLLWAVQLTASARTGVLSGQAKWWFFTMVFVFFTYYTGASVVTVWRSPPGGRDVFINILPTAAGFLGYLACLMVVQASGTGQRSLGIAGAGIATFLLCIAAFRAMESTTRPGGINLFAFPSAFLLALSFRDVSGKSVAALAVLSWAAVSLAWLSNRWSSEGVRVTSYFLQAMVLGASSLMLLRIPSGSQQAAAVFSLAFTGLAALCHYVLVRRNPPEGLTAYFSVFDRKDLSGITPLLVAAGSVFLALRSVSFLILDGSGQAFQAAETSIISLGALVFFAAAWLRKSTELKWIAASITVLGGGKVFFYDLFKVKGMPVLLSFVAFALAASMGSMVMKRWPEQDHS